MADTVCADPFSLPPSVRLIAVFLVPLASRVEDGPSAFCSYGCLDLSVRERRKAPSDFFYYFLLLFFILTRRCFEKCGTQIYDHFLPTTKGFVFVLLHLFCACAYVSVCVYVCVSATVFW